MEVLMNYKLAALIILTALFLYQMLLEIIQYRSANRPTPENVRDIYDEETYRKWKQYSHEKCRLSILFTIVSFVISFVLLLTDAYAAVSSLAGHSVYGGAILALLLSLLASNLLMLPLQYHDTLKIEEKYGFNRSGCHDIAGAA